MSDEEDIDLLALQRQLDDAFKTTRPRRGFEDELWLRIQTRRPIWQRLQDGFAGLLETVREVPAVPAGAVATVLILAIGLGLLARNGVHFGGAVSTTSSGTAAQPAGSQFAMAPNSFGRLPPVALYPGVPYPSVKGSPFPADALEAGSPAIPVNLYFGPAALSWTGQFPVSVAPALVYRYHEPSQALADQFATSVGAAPANQGQTASGYLGTYTGQGFSLAISFSSSAPPREPRFVLAPSGGTVMAGTDSTAVAIAFLSMHSLTPAWQYAVDVATSGNQIRVRLQRAFQLPNGGQAYLVGGLGERYGTDVLLKGGLPVLADGPLSVNLDTASYPLITEGQAVKLAVASPASGSQVISPVPVVALDKVELVYALAFSGGQGFYEPAYLFSGSFQYQGQTMVKRVLVPAVDPSQLNS